MSHKPWQELYCFPEQASFTDELHSLSFETLVALWEQKLFRASKMLILCFWHQYLICIFLRAVNNKKIHFPVPVAFLVSFVLLSAYTFPWETPEQSLEISTNFDEIGNSWSLGDNETVILQTPRLMRVSFTAVIISVAYRTSNRRFAVRSLCCNQNYNKVVFLSSLITENPSMFFARLIFVICKAGSFILFVTSFFFKWVTLLAVGRVQGVLAAHSCWYLPLMAVGEAQRAALSAA